MGKMGNNDNMLVIILVIILISILFGGYGMLSGGHYVGYYGFGWLFGIIALISAVWIIYDIIVNNKKLSDGMKILWIVFALFFSIITAIIYYLVGRNQKNDLFRR
jgi:hypothetical protein